MEMTKWCMLLLLVLAASRSAAATPQYIIHDLGTFGGLAGQLNAINNSNVAVGSSYVEYASYNAIYYSGGAWRVISEGVASGINDAGVVVGTTPGTGGDGQPWYWDGERHDYPGRRAVDINNLGHIAGRGAGVPGSGSLWIDGVHHSLGTLGEGDIEVRALNNNDQVVGTFIRDIPGTRAFLSQNGVMQDLGVLTGRSESQAVGINDQGVVVGWSRNRGEFIEQVGFLYDGQMHELPFVPAGINNLGQIIGGGGVFDHGELHPLPGLGGGVLWGGPLAINDNGWVVGYARSGASLQLPSHAVIWEPVPEPGGMAALGAMLVGFALAGLRLRA